MTTTHPDSSYGMGVTTRLGRLLASLLVLTVVSGCGGGGGQAVAPTPTPLPPQPEIQKPTYTVERGDIVEELVLSARVAAVLQEDLFFEEGGRVATIHVRATDPITKGQLLAELDQGDLENQLAAAQLMLDQARLTLERGQARQQFAIELAELALEEAQIMLEQADTAVGRELAEIGVRRAEIALEEARSMTDEDLEQQVAQAQLEYDRIRAAVDALRLYAPFDGVTGDIAMAPGDTVEAFQPVMTVLDPGERELRVESAISTDLARLSPQQPVTIRFSRYPDTPIEGVIERLPQAATTGASAVQADTAVHISYDPGDLELDIGDLAQVTVTLQRKENVLWLPPQAVRTFQGRRFVVIQDGDRQRRVDVKLGIAGPDKVEIVEGLEEGAEVIGQ